MTLLLLVGEIMRILLVRKKSWLRKLVISEKGHFEISHFENESLPEIGRLKNAFFLTLNSLKFDLQNKTLFYADKSENK